ncbi:MAG: ABC transporter permease [Dehalococcoidales bacterium]|jgi:ABC-2 type transport system permease protein
MKNLKHIWFYAIKDLKIFITDRTSLFFSLAFPIMFIVLFTFLLKGVGGEDKRLTLHLATQEPAGGLSQQILGSIETQDPSLLKPGDPQIVWDRDYNAAKAAVDNGTIDGFIGFPADFSQAVAAETGTSLEVYVNASATNAQAALNGMAQAIASQIGTNKVAIHASIDLMVKNGIIGSDSASIAKASQDLLAKEMAGGTANAAAAYVTYRTESIGAVKAINSSNFVVPGYLVMFVFMAAGLSAIAVVQERQNHTLERLLSTSVSKEAILGGIFTGSVIRGLIQIIIFWAVGILVFNVDMGLSPGAVILLSVLMVVMSSAFALMLATLARTMRSASSLAVLTSLLLAPLGGCWWPSFLYPQWLQNISKIVPHAWATEGFNKLMLFGAGFGDAAPSMIALAAFALAFGLIAIWRFRTDAA